MLCDRQDLVDEWSQLQTEVQIQHAVQEFKMDETAVPIKHKPLSAQGRRLQRAKHWWRARKTWRNIVLCKQRGKVHPSLRDRVGRFLVEFVDGHKIWVSQKLVQ